MRENPIEKKIEEEFAKIRFKQKCLVQKRNFIEIGKICNQKTQKPREKN